MGALSPPRRCSSLTYSSLTYSALKYEFSLPEACKPVYLEFFHSDSKGVVLNGNGLLQPQFIVQIKTESHKNSHKWAQ